MYGDSLSKIYPLMIRLQSLMQVICVAIVCAEWNANITEKLLFFEGACNTLEKHGVKRQYICRSCARDI